MNQHESTLASSRIRVLPDHLANKIAAGEVIQRPESVVKELLENSLDAGAGNITIVIKEGGKKLIQITDDGIGMDEADARVSFLRHATSKISSYEDLEAISTYGFRGEALASVAAVAQVTMKTRRREDDAAVVIQMDGGGEQRVSREGRVPGTTIIVQNLFFNVPARRKFLKSTNTEFRHIYDVVQRVALSHPEVGVQFVSDDNIILDVKPATLQERMVDVFGERLVEGMVWTEEQTDILSVAGYIGKPQFGQKNRLNQYLYLNRRFIVNRNINHAVFSAYENLLIKGTYPFFLLFITIDPHRVDVNVHPSKMEAKFEDEQAIYRFISTLVRRTLSTNDLIPSASVTGSNTEGDGFGLRFTQRQHVPFVGYGTAQTAVKVPTFEAIPHREERAPLFGNGGEITDRLLRASGAIGQPIPPQHQQETLVEFTPSLMWQVHNKYIVVQIDNGLMVVDQHVAHERVLYERALARFESGMPVSQQLLFPRTVLLLPSDYALVLELQSYLDQLGFQIKPFGKNTIAIEGVPTDIKSGAEVQVLQDILALYKENLQHGQIDVRDNVAKTYSCKAAIKAGDPLSDTEMRSLLEQLFKTKIPYVCPHGRPVVLKIAIDELDRRFGRT